MTQRQINRLTTLVLLQNQKEAVLTALEAGYQPSPDDLKAVGIADPYRVINKLRYERGAPIYLNTRYTSKGERVRRYRLGTPKQHSNAE
jgi:hypothetical protein